MALIDIEKHEESSRLINFVFVELRDFNKLWPHHYPFRWRQEKEGHRIQYTVWLVLALGNKRIKRYTWRWGVAWICCPMVFAGGTCGVSG